MQKSVLLCVIVVLALSAGSLSAAVVQCPAQSDLATLIATFTTLDNACFSQDKLFWNFSYTPGTNAPAAGDVSMSLIANPLPGGVDIHGWNLGGANNIWAQGAPGTADFLFSFTIEVCPASVPECAGNVAPGTVITGADAVYAPVSTFLPGPETVTWSNGGSATLTSGSPGALPPGGDIGLGGAGTLGPITVTANFSGTGAITQTTLRFYETVPQPPPGVPEPATVAMMFGGLGLIGLGCFKRTRRTR